MTAGFVAAGASAVPSTTWTLLVGGDILEGARAAGALILPNEHRTSRLLAAAVPVHVALSLGLALILEALLPRRHEPLYGMLGGLGIAALDLGVVGRRMAAIRALEQPPQWLDHAAYGLAVGLVLKRRRRDPPGRVPAVASDGT